MQVTQELEFADNSDDDQSSAQPSGVPTHAAAAEMFEKCVLWYEHQDEAEPETLLHLKKVHTLAATKRFSNLKQKTLSSFARKH